MRVQWQGGPFDGGEVDLPDGMKALRVSALEGGVAPEFWGDGDRSIESMPVVHWSVPVSQGQLWWNQKRRVG